ncbi:hypothetical protein FHS29_003735 [Saccharothrix tamanrassetensis]|uniref:Uncharacterized protein n=1 Tax=Saccharothrix tamanrassetensis TaxID=1051531 RepID=A0A841CF15_9PSEU|nr:hypothetical protein [Saccharothrix tamanrassetensis]MBB5957142.1 hypothetical protein [Saccharothrix tamanrassetensis]
MPDLDLPPPRSLPDGARDTALLRLRAGFDTPRPRHLPLKAGAAIVALATATTLVVQAVDRHDSAVSPGQERSEVPELPLPIAAEHYELREGTAPEGAAQRCHAGSTGLPPFEQWTPIATTSLYRVDLTAFKTATGTVFCETTPSSVTVSSPQTDPGVLTLSFSTATGSMAGFAGTDSRPFVLRDRPDATGREAVTARSGRVFLAPAGFVADAVAAQPEVAGSGELVQRTELSPPVRSTPVIDRPVPPQDRTGPEGRRLGECLAGTSKAVPDPSAWRAGQIARLTATESVQLAHYEDLLLLCHQNGAVSISDLKRADAREPAGSVWFGNTLRGVQMFYDFVESTPGSASTSSTVALIAEVTDPRVATVTATITGGPDVTVRPVAGSVVVPGLALNHTGQTEVTITARDAGGTVLDEVRRNL